VKCSACSTPRTEGVFTPNEKSADRSRGAVLGIVVIRFQLARSPDELSWWHKMGASACHRLFHSFRSPLGPLALIHGRVRLGASPAPAARARFFQSGIRGPFPMPGHQRAVWFHSRRASTSSGQNGKMRQLGWVSPDGWSRPINPQEKRAQGMASAISQAHAGGGCGRP